MSSYNSYSSGYKPPTTVSNLGSLRTRLGNVSSPISTGTSYNTGGMASGAYGAGRQASGMAGANAAATAASTRSNLQGAASSLRSGLNTLSQGSGGYQAPTTTTVAPQSYALQNRANNHLSPSRQALANSTANSQVIAQDLNKRLANPNLVAPPRTTKQQVKDLYNRGADSFSRGQAAYNVGQAAAGGDPVGALLGNRTGLSSNLSGVASGTGAIAGLVGQPGILKSRGLQSTVGATSPATRISNSLNNNQIYKGAEGAANLLSGRSPIQSTLSGITKGKTDPFFNKISSSAYNNRVTGPVLHNMDATQAMSGGVGQNTARVSPGAATAGSRLVDTGYTAMELQNRVPTLTANEAQQGEYYSQGRHRVEKAFKEQQGLKQQYLSQHANYAKQMTDKGYSQQQASQAAAKFMESNPYFEERGLTQRQLRQGDAAIKQSTGDLRGIYDRMGQAGTLTKMNDARLSRANSDLSSGSRQVQTEVLKDSALGSQQGNIATIGGLATLATQDPRFQQAGRLIQGAVNLPGEIKEHEIYNRDAQGRQYLAPTPSGKIDAFGENVGEGFTDITRGMNPLASASRSIQTAVGVPTGNIKAARIASTPTTLGANLLDQAILDPVSGLVRRVTDSRPIPQGYQEGKTGSEAGGWMARMLPFGKSGYEASPQVQAQVGRQAIADKYGQEGLNYLDAQTPQGREHVQDSMRGVTGGRQSFMSDGSTPVASASPDAYLAEQGVRPDGSMAGMMPDRFGTMRDIFNPANAQHFSPMQMAQAEALAGLASLPRHPGAGVANTAADPREVQKRSRFEGKRPAEVKAILLAERQAKIDAASISPKQRQMMSGVDAMRPSATPGSLAWAAAKPSAVNRANRENRGFWENKLHNVKQGTQFDKATRERDAKIQARLRDNKAAIGKKPVALAQPQVNAPVTVGRPKAQGQLANGLRMPQGMAPVGNITTLGSLNRPTVGRRRR